MCRCSNIDNQYNKINDLYVNGDIHNVHVEYNDDRYLSAILVD